MTRTGDADPHVSDLATAMALVTVQRAQQDVNPNNGRNIGSVEGFSIPAKFVTPSLM